jgi:tetratricopeptide (TPR) repeat protein
LLPRDRVKADFHRFLAPRERTAEDLAELSRGFLSSFVPTFSALLAEWLEYRRSEVLARIRRTLTTELIQHRADARWTACEQTARALLALDPFNEEATLALAEVMAIGGSKIEAVRLLDSYLSEVGPHDRAMRVPAGVLRRRIVDRLPDAPPNCGTGFVGRDDPLALLRRILDRVQAGEGTACHIWGEAGIGKTRLVAEFARVATIDGARVEHLSCQPHDQRRPMGAFSDLVPRLLQLPGSLGCSPEAITFLTKLFKFDGALTNTVSSDVADPELLSANITRAISELLDAVTTECTVAVIVDDAQWLDPISLRVFADLIAERKNRRLLLVITSREPQMVMLNVAPERMRGVRLGPLSAADSVAVLSGIFGPRGVAADFRLTEWCLRVAGGNPFFLHSAALHYITTRDCERIPEPLASLLGQRLGRLSEPALHVFEAVCVLGRHSTYDNLMSLLGVSTYQLALALRSLEELDFIAVVGPSVSPTHALLSEVAVQRTPSSVLRLLHRNAAKLMHRLSDRGDSARALWDCAEHWLQAGDATESATALRACGRHALEMGHPGDAVRALRRAVDLPLDQVTRLTLLRELLTASEIASDWRTILHTVGAIRAHRVGQGYTADLDPRLELLAVHATLCVAADPADAVERLRRYVRDEALTIAERMRSCKFLVAASEVLLSPALAHEAYAIAASLPENQSAATDKVILELIYHASFGDVQYAIDPSKRLILIAEEAKTASSKCQMLVYAAGGLLRAGQLSEGCTALENAYTVALAAGLSTGQQRAANLLACVLRETDRIDEARAWYARSLFAFDRLGGRETACDFYSNCIQFAIADGDYDAATEWLRRAFEEAPRARIGGTGLVFSALQLRVKQLSESYDCPDAELDELLEAHLRHRGLHHHDEILEAIWHALARKGRVAAGTALVHEYFAKYRRHKLPVVPGLQRILNQVAVPVSPSADGRVGL